MLIGLPSGQVASFPRVAGLLERHISRDGFMLVVPMDEIDAGLWTRIENGEDYIAGYNRALSRWWEQEHES